MKKQVTLILCILLSLAAIFAFTACSGSNNQTGGGTDTSQQDTAGGTDADGENAGTGTDTGDGNADNSGALPPSDWGKVLIVYYSRTGNTEAVANTIHSLLPDADLFEVERAEPYPDGYTKTTEVAQEELQSNARPGTSRFPRLGSAVWAFPTPTVRRPTRTRRPGTCTFPGIGKHS